MVLGDQGTRDLVLVRTLFMSGDCIFPYKTGMSTYPWIYYAWRLGLHDTFNESETSNTHSGQFGVHSAENVGFDCGHKLPYGGIIGVSNAVQSQGKSERDTQQGKVEHERRARGDVGATRKGQVTT
jgi:hypothetical protein